MKLALIESQALSNHFLIERADHDSTVWHELSLEYEDSSRYMRAARVSAEADIEGSLEEMKEIARGIRYKYDVRFKRCALKWHEGLGHLCSPRNSDGWTPIAYLDLSDLANQIDDVVVKIQS